MENAHFYSEWHCFVFDVVTNTNTQKKEVVKYGDKDNFNMVKKH